MISAWLTAIPAEPWRNLFLFTASCALAYLLGLYHGRHRAEAYYMATLAAFIRCTEQTLPTYWWTRIMRAQQKRMEQGRRP